MEISETRIPHEKTESIGLEQSETQRKKTPGKFSAQISRFAMLAAVGMSLKGDVSATYDSPNKVIEKHTIPIVNEVMTDLNVTSISTPPSIYSPESYIHIDGNEDIVSGRNSSKSEIIQREQSILVLSVSDRELIEEFVESQDIDWVNDDKGKLSSTGMIEGYLQDAYDNEEAVDFKTIFSTISTLDGSNFDDIYQFETIFDATYDLLQARNSGLLTEKEYNYAFELVNRVQSKFPDNNARHFWDYYSAIVLSGIDLEYFEEDYSSVLADSPDRSDAYLSDLIRYIDELSDSDKSHDLHIESHLKYIRSMSDEHEVEYLATLSSLTGYDLISDGFLDTLTDVSNNIEQYDSILDIVRSSDLSNLLMTVHTLGLPYNENGEIVEADKLQFVFDQINKDGNGFMIYILQMISSTEGAEDENKYDLISDTMEGTLMNLADRYNSNADAENASLHFINIINGAYHDEFERTGRDTLRQKMIDSLSDESLFQLLSDPESSYYIYTSTYISLRQRTDSIEDDEYQKYLSALSPGEQYIYFEQVSRFGVANSEVNRGAVVIDQYREVLQKVIANEDPYVLSNYLDFSELMLNEDAYKDEYIDMFIAEYEKRINLLSQERVDFDEFKRLSFVAYVLMSNKGNLSDAQVQKLENNRYYEQLLESYENSHVVEFPKFEGEIDVVLLFSQASEDREGLNSRATAEVYFPGYSKEMLSNGDMVFTREYSGGRSARVLVTYDSLSQYYEQTSEMPDIVGFFGHAGMYMYQVDSMDEMVDGVDTIFMLGECSSSSNREGVYNRFGTRFMYSDNDVGQGFVNMLLTSSLLNYLGNGGQSISGLNETSFGNRKDERGIVGPEDSEQEYVIFTYALMDLYKNGMEPSVDTPISE